MTVNEYVTDQENFWSGDFGNSYIARNNGKSLLASNLNFFSKALNRSGDVNSFIEFGANIGMNLIAIGHLYPSAKRFGVEINSNACDFLRKEVGSDCVFEGSIFDFKVEHKYELSLIKGVLIHIEPRMLDIVYEKLYESSSKYILICEYYNPSPVSVLYRGHEGKLFKRDFAGEILDKYKDLKLIDYGFSYHRDPSFPQDDITWFLLEKLDRK